MNRLEHINVTVTDPHNTAKLLQHLFGWKIRWEGAAKLGGYTVHVGGNDDYIALYAHDDMNRLDQDDRIAGGFNHLGVVVDDLDTIDKKVTELGLKPHSHQDYEPGKRFYFTDDDGLEFEIVSYES